MNIAFPFLLPARPSVRPSVRLSACLSYRLPGLMPSFPWYSSGNIQFGNKSTAGRFGGTPHLLEKKKKKRETPTDSGSKCETIACPLQQWNLFQKKKKEKWSPVHLTCAAGGFGASWSAEGWRRGYKRQKLIITFNRLFPAKVSGSV